MSPFGSAPRGPTTASFFAGGFGRNLDLRLQHVAATENLRRLAALAGSAL